MFGFTGKATQGSFLHDVFTSLPPHYDLINHLFTLGLDGRWRLLAVRECLKGNPQKVLDICCGTGDLSLTIANMGSGCVEVTGIDFSRPMLEKAKQKAEKRGLSDRVSFISGDIAAIPFPDGHFDCIGVSFAFRNLTYKNPFAGKYIAEVIRVLKPGGRFVIVESSQPHPGSKIIKWLHRFYVRHIVYRVGWLVSGNKEAYCYLSDSALNYYGAEELQRFLTESGFSRVSFRRLLLGAAAIHVAII
ncbi:MAG TPA: ubiquinone/menaquinone biosynthesis methyltransferase [Dehalococcoidia bacterium]|nr:ubiquinone/menaquinone biosynthesis methyltransferase [Dehalococcoidia bacterium]